MDADLLRRSAQPEELRAALRTYSDELSHAANPHSGSHDLVDVRVAEHAGHEIVVRTHYEIAVDGQPFDVHLSVTNNGRVHYHGLPTRDFPSVIDLVEKVIDTFGDEFEDPPSKDGDEPDHPGPHHDSSGGH